MSQTTAPPVSGPLPESPGAAASHLIAEHGWDAETAVGHHSNLQDAHFYAHGGAGRPDLADPELAHAHGVASQPAIDWRGGYLPAILAGLAIAAAGLVLPWVSVVAAFIGQLNVKGLDTTDGKIIGVGILLLGAVAYGEARSSQGAGRVVLLVGALILLGVAGYELADISRRLADINGTDFGHAEVGYGLYVTVGGALTATIGAALRLGKR